MARVQSSLDKLRPLAQDPCVRPTSPSPPPSPPGWAANRLRYHVSSHMHILALHGREVGGHLLLYVLGSLFFSLKGEWFPSEDYFLHSSGPQCPPSSFSFLFFPIIAYTCISLHMHYCTVLTLSRLLLPSCGIPGTPEEIILSSKSLNNWKLIQTSVKM